jgi:hypothetical protein
VLVVLQEIPRTREAWDRFSWHHRSSHVAIRQAIQARGGPNLPDYQLDPINFDRFTDFLQSNSQTHIDMNGALGLQSVDLQDVDIRQENQLVSWTNLHYLEHYAAEMALKI